MSVLSNKRMKLAGRGRRVSREGSVLIAAAPARSLCAVR
jgi:hypothetical protein